MTATRWLAWGLVVVGSIGTAEAQQRPFETQDPDSIAAGMVRVQLGVTHLRSQTYPVSGLRGNLTTIPSLSLGFGVGGLAEFQIDHASYQVLAVRERFAAPRSLATTFEGDRTSSFDDLVVGAKVRLLAETATRPALGFHFSTRLPNASDESGLGLDTMDFRNSVLVGKTLGRFRTVANLGLGILSDPTLATRQNDVVLFGVSVTGQVSERVVAVVEINGHQNTRSREPPPGTDSSGFLRAGLRYRLGAVTVDGAAVVGLHDDDGSVGVAFGVSWRFSGLPVE